METCPIVSTPLAAVDYKDFDRNKTDQQVKPLSNSDARLYRRGTEIAVYISQDRPDFNAVSRQFATRTRGPTEYDWERSKRLGRYARGWLRCVLRYPSQDEETANVCLTMHGERANEART